ncbi:MAG: hypothetical protein JNM13_00575 [Hyphomicrobiaceae bacterium]|nr:hypothetical protein [Hyphomicrobiaceae bacterium]
MIERDELDLIPQILPPDLGEPKAIDGPRPTGEAHQPPPDDHFNAPWLTILRYVVALPLAIGLTVWFAYLLGQPGSGYPVFVGFVLSFLTDLTLLFGPNWVERLIKTLIAIIRPGPPNDPNPG